LFIPHAGCNWFSVGTDRATVDRWRLTARCHLFARERRARRWIERPLACARSQSKRRGQRADQGEADKWTAITDQDRRSLHGGTIAKQTNKAKSGFFLFQ